MVKITRRGDACENGVIVEGIVETEAELETDPQCIAAAPGSLFEADDWSFVSKKRIDGSWKTVSTGL